MTAPVKAFANLRCAHGYRPDLRNPDTDVLVCPSCALAEFAAEITCADCGLVRDDCSTCEGCGVVGCRCEVIDSRQLCDRWSGGDLCTDCADTYTCRGRCPDCDPPDPRDR